jgi:hypothetical protein
VDSEDAHESWKLHRATILTDIDLSMSDETREEPKNKYWDDEIVEGAQPARCDERVTAREGTRGGREGGWVGGWMDGNAGKAGS